MPLTKSEAGKIGAATSSRIAREARDRRVAEYNLNPTLCGFCKSPLQYERRKNKFCSSSCSAKSTNVTTPRRGDRASAPISFTCDDVKPKEKRTVTINRTQIACKNCNKLIWVQPHRPKIFCSTTCNHDFRRKETKARVEAGHGSHHQVKRYLIEQYGHRCQGCKQTHHMGQPIPLELEHKGGRHEENTLEVCMLLCPNCHALTDTYKAKNKGKGRPHRKQRYQDGKSY